MDNTKLIKLIYLKSALKCDSFDVAIDIKIPFFRILVTIEPGRSLLQFVTTNFLNSAYAKRLRGNGIENFPAISSILSIYSLSGDNGRKKVLVLVSSCSPDLAT